MQNNLRPVVVGVMFITLLLLFFLFFTKKEDAVEIDNTEIGLNNIMGDTPLNLSDTNSNPTTGLTGKTEYASLNIDVPGQPEYPEGYEVDPTKIDRANEVFRKIPNLAESGEWEEIISLAHEMIAKNIYLGEYIFLEVARHNAPTHVFARLSNLGLKLPENASEFLIGTSEVTTLQALVDDYGLDLNHFNEVTGNAFSYAVTSDAPTEVYEFLVQNEATLDNFGRFEPVEKLINEALIPGDKNEIEKITILLDYGAILTQQHYERAYKFSNYRPELFTLIDQYYKNKQTVEGN